MLFGGGEGGKLGAESEGELAGVVPGHLLLEIEVVGGTAGDGGEGQPQWTRSALIFGSLLAGCRRGGGALELRIDGGGERAIVLPLNNKVQLLGTLGGNEPPVR